MIVFIVTLTQYLLLFNLNRLFVFLKLPVVIFLVKGIIVDRPQS
jgi:hypothetical protein